MQMQRKILVIDDDGVTRELLKSVLTNADYEVVLAADGLSGVETARSEKPDLVITDGLLPKLHGFLVCKAIKEFDSPPKVIILTGLYTKPTYKWTVKHEYGADDLLLGVGREDVAVLLVVVVTEKRVVVDGDLRVECVDASIGCQHERVDLDE